MKCNIWIFLFAITFLPIFESFEASDGCNGKKKSSLDKFLRKLMSKNESSLDTEEDDDGDDDANEMVELYDSAEEYSNAELVLGEREKISNGSMPKSEHEEISWFEGLFSFMLATGDGSVFVSQPNTTMSGENLKDGRRAEVYCVAARGGAWPNLRMTINGKDAGVQGQRVGDRHMANVSLEFEPSSTNPEDKEKVVVCQFDADDSISATFAILYNTTNVIAATPEGSGPGEMLCIADGNPEPKYTISFYGLDCKKANATPTSQVFTNRALIYYPGCFQCIVEQTHGDHNINFVTDFIIVSAAEQISRPPVWLYMLFVSLALITAQM